MSSAARLSRLRAAFADKQLNQLLVTNPVNVRYLSGFTGTNGTLLIGPQKAVLLTDFRYITQAAEQSPDFEVIDGGSEPRKRLAEAVEGDRLGFDQADMRVQSHQQLLKALPAETKLIEAAGIVERLRAVKDDAELDAIRRAAGVADEIYAAIAERGLIGRSETDVAWQIQSLAHELGSSGLSFPPIVASGPHGALPHAEPREHRIEPNQLVVLDLGVIVDGYCSDATRTFATGQLPTEAVEVYELVELAQRAGLDALVVGADCKAVDKAARDVIDAAGRGKQFGHSTGHGVGLEVHELPTLSSRSDQSLAAGNVVTVEPGVYVEGAFGVRIEDLVAVTQDGIEIFSGFTKKLTFVD